jgi:predicted nucleic acid-binding protein
MARGASGLYSSSLCIAELACVLHRQVREGSLDADQSLILRRYFEGDTRRGIWGLIPVTDRLLEGVDLLVRKLPAECYIRAGDAIHLASAIAAGFEEIWTSDRRLSSAAEHVGLKGRSVEQAG